MKKMKGVVVSVESQAYPVVYEDQRTRLRHQSLLQDYEDLLEETNSMKMKLQAAKQKRLTLSAEVSFLRKRYKYLLKNPSPKSQPKQDISQPRKLKIQANLIPKGQKYNRKESMQPPVAPHLNSNVRISNGAEINTLHKKAHMFDLNQNARSLSRKDPSFLSSAPPLDLNHKDMNHSMKEPAKKSITPFFDLNQIAREEEEFLVTEPVKIEEPKRITQRGMSEEQLNDIKLSICRNDGSGSSRTTVKRKISWQDQVALRV